MDKFDKAESGFYDSIKLNPIGIMPEYIWIEHRIQDISNAIIRFAEADLDIPKEWYEERNKHINWLKWRKYNEI